MTVTVPLRLAADIIETVDRIIDRRDGEGSRNSVLREAIRKGLRVMEDS